MAIIPKQMLDALHAINPEHLSEIEEKIDTTLTDPDQVNLMVYDRDINPSFTFTFPMILTRDTKEAIIKHYTDAGWGRVVCNNHYKLDGRTGNCDVFLSVYHPDNITDMQFSIAQ